MSTTSQKHQNFVSEVMGEKSVKTVPGIDNTTANRLEQQGYVQAKQLLGSYLTNTQADFISMLGAKANVNRDNANRAYNAMKTWENNFL